MIKSTYSIRKAFLDFFKSKKHKILKSSSLIPKNDDTLLFTNAGMNQFKKKFMGLEKINYSRIATSQRCIRVGGENNDLKNIGNTLKHNTFFEMLGNFSFNDYFKFDAINYAWDLLTNKKWFNLPINKLLVTVYSSDKETFNIWNKIIKIPKNKIILVGDNKNIPFKSDNFWKMGYNYPCGPCTEIFYDKETNINKNLIYNKKLNERYIEIWNIVFIQFIYQYNGVMKPLSNLSIDTGMGLERIASIIQGVNSNYEIDIFKKITNNIYKISNKKNINTKSINIVADHIRTIAFLILDGVLPSNEKRGYILRKIIRRTIIHGNKLGIKDFFLNKLINNLIICFGDQENNYIKKKKIIKQIINDEEKKFIYSLKKGLNLLNLELLKVNNNILKGDVIFNLHDTYGVPFNLIKEICLKKKIKLDEINFNLLMNNQRLKSLNSNNVLIKKKKINYNNNNYNIFKKTITIKIIAIFYKSCLVNKIFYNDEAILILNNNLYNNKINYIFGDKCILININTIFLIYNTKKYNDIILYFGIVIKGNLIKNQIIKVIINKKTHFNILKNNYVIYLLYDNLMKVFNNNIKKINYYVNHKYLKFDILCNYKININKIYFIEKLVNKQIFYNLSFKNYNFIKKKIILNIKKNKNIKYTGEIGLFCIKSCNYISNNIFRIICTTGDYALKLMQYKNHIINIIENLLNTNIKNINNILKNIYNNKNKNKKKIKQYNNYILNNILFFLFEKIYLFNGIKLIINNIKILDINLLINSINNFIKKVDTSIIILIFKKKNKINLIIGITFDLVKYIKLNLIMIKIIQKIGGKGKTSHNLLKIEINNINIINVLYKYLKFLFKNK